MAKAPTNRLTNSMIDISAWRRSMAGILAGLILIGALSACDPAIQSSSLPNLSNANVLRYDVNAPFTSLHPAIEQASGSNHIFPLLYSYLFVPNAKGDLIPDLATRWTFDADKRQWEIHLRKNARFHDQQPVTAADVKFALETYISRRSVDLRSVIDRIVATSDKILTIGLIRDDPLVLHKIWGVEIVPLSKNGRPADEGRAIGSGPFKFSHRSGNQKVTLEANTNYYGGPPSLDRVVFYFQSDREKAWTRLLGNRTDIAQEITPKNYHIVSQYQDRFYFDINAMRYYTILLFNLNDPLFSDVRVRKALTLGIDRGYIVDHILNKFGRLTAGPMGMDSPFHNPDVIPTPFDPAQALALLHQAGWHPDENGRLYKNSKPFEFTIYIFKESQIEKKVGQFIQLCLNSLGIKAFVKDLDSDELIANYYQNTRFQAVLTELNGVYNRIGVTDRIWSPGAHGKAYAGCFDHPEVNRLLEKTFAATDTSTQKGLLRELDALIASLYPGTFLFQKTAIDAMSRRFHLPHPFTLTMEGISRLKDASIDHTYMP